MIIKQNYFVRKINIHMLIFSKQNLMLKFFFIWSAIIVITICIYTILRKKTFNNVLFCVPTATMPDANIRLSFVRDKKALLGYCLTGFNEIRDQVKQSVPIPCFGTHCLTGGVYWHTLLYLSKYAFSKILKYFMYIYNTK